MDEHCKYCDQPRKPRHDRPGKFFTLCADHMSAYNRRKAHEHYHRNEDKMRQRAREYRADHPEKVAEAVREYNNRPEVIERKRRYMRHYNAPYRVHIKDACELCGYKTRNPQDPRDLDIHHVDGNRENNDPSNLQTLCPPCHRLI